MNKCMNALLYLGFIAVTVMSVRSMYGAVEVPRFLSSFKTDITKHGLAVVHFVNYDVLPQEHEEDKSGEVAASHQPKDVVNIQAMPLKTQHDANTMNLDKEPKHQPSQADYMLDMLEDMKEAFKAASKSERYNRAHIGFIGVDVTQIPQLIDDYDLGDEFSTLMLFKDGVPFKVKGEVVKTNVILTSRSKIKDFIDVHFDDIITDVLEDQEDEMRARPVRRVTRVYRTYPSYSYSYPGYYPWGGYWRGGWGWRYPYWRRYGGWGSPFGGIGFGFGGRRGGFGIGFGW